MLHVAPAFPGDDDGCDNVDGHCHGVLLYGSVLWFNYRNVTSKDSGELQCDVSLAS